jgi:RHS repeat-associated protein
MLPGCSFKATATESFYLRTGAATDVSVFSGKNYQSSEETKVAGVSNELQLDQLTLVDKNVVYEYYDDLARKVQTVSGVMTPLHQDMVTSVQYIGNTEVKTYLPYPKTNGVAGQFVPAAVSEQMSFYQSPSEAVVTDTRPYSVEYSDNSPLGRVDRKVGFGQAWAGKSTITRQEVNVANEVLHWDDCLGGFPALASASANYYDVNSLLVEVSTGEDGKVVKSFKNMRGQKVLDRVIDGANNLDTYQIYSPADLLMFVIQPEGVARLVTEFFAAGADKQAFLDRWAFQYKYDDEQRMIAKRIPGSAPGADGWSYIVYDKWNRVVLTQDPEQRPLNKYTFTKYDILNRPIITGSYTSAKSLADLRADVAASDARSETHTTTVTFPVTATEADWLTVTYYDSYNFLQASWDAESNNFAYVNIGGYPQKTSDNANEVLTFPRGSTTGSKVRILESSTWLNSVSYYDKNYNLVQSIAESHRGGVVRITKKFDFTKDVEKSQRYQSGDGLTTEETYEYDNADRVTTVKHSVNGSTPIMILVIRYNELGHPVERNTHSVDNGATFLQSEDRRYNIRGWLTQINNSALIVESGDTNPDLFGLELEYNPAATTTLAGAVFTTKKYYAGNVSSVRWSTNNLKDAPVRKIYGFDYDNLSRLKKGYYATYDGGAWNSNAGLFDEEVKGYDLNGNIKGPADQANVGLLRYGNVQGTRAVVDELKYSYDLNGVSSNRLIRVTDSGNSLGFKDVEGLTEEYQYDRNGNLIFDFNKGISNVIYNSLNLPRVVQFTRPDASVDKVEYTYDALGTKLRKVVKVGSKTVWTTDYVQGVQYDNNQLSFLNISEGRVVANNGAFEYEYFMKDHVNNVRVVYGQLKDTRSYRATMETELAVQEENLQAGFQNVAARRLNPPNAALNYTKSSDRVLIPGRSALCNASLGQSVGPAKSLRVLSGDAVYMEVFAKYTQPTGSPSVITAAVLGAAINSAFGIPSTGETATLYSGIQSNAAAAAGAIPAGAVQPKAYLVYLFFDDNYVYQRSGAIGISVDAFNVFEKLSRSFTADRNGYLYIYVASESNVSAANVYFDEMYVVHQKNTSTLQVLQTTDYYPFGLAFNEYQADRLKGTDTNPVTYEPTLRNRHLFQGKELQKDLDLNWYDMGARMMDPALGRFLSIDPKAESDADQTPYHYVLNNPVLLIDPTGESWSYNPSNYVSANTQIYQVEQRMAARFNYSLTGTNPWHWTTEYSVPGKAAYTQDLYQWAGKAPSGAGYGARYSSGDNGTFLKVMANVGEYIPLFGPLANGIKAGRQGDWGVAAVNFAFAAADVGLFANSTSLALPRGFESASQFNRAGNELRFALSESGIHYNSIGVRGSSITGVSSKGGSFRWQAQNGLKASDIDVYINLTDNLGLKTSTSIPGFLHPNKMMRNYPALDSWSSTWSQELGRQITPAGFVPNYWPTYNTMSFPY